MNGFASRITGWLALLVGVIGALAFVSLLLFFVSLFQNISSLSFMGSFNDFLNGLVGLMSAIFASVLHRSLRRSVPRLSLILLISVWIGAIAIGFGSWLIMTDRADVELSSYYFFFGNGLIGVWLLMLNRMASIQAAWPRNLTGLGLLASVFMMVGLLGLYGILQGIDGSDYSPLMMITGISYFGISIFYPLWCLQLGRWILSNQNAHEVISST